MQRATTAERNALRHWSCSSPNVTAEIAYVLLVAGAALLLFITEWVRMDQVALGVPVLLFLGGAIDMETAISGLSNPATVAVAAFLVLGMAVEKTGLTRSLAYLTARVPLAHRSMKLVLLCAVVAALSPFLSNIAVVVVFMPLFVALARGNGEPPSRYLIPLSYTAILGGTVTLIGTSTNLVVYNLARNRGYDDLTLFSITPLGLLYLGVGSLYVFTVGRWLLPDRDGTDPLAQKVSTRLFTTDLTVTSRSRVIGLSPEHLDWRERYGLARVRVLHPWYQVLPSQRRPLEAGDIISVTGDADAIFRCAKAERLDTPQSTLPPSGRGNDARVVELMVSPHSRLTGRSVTDLDFRNRYGAVVLGLQPVRRPVAGCMSRERLRGGDLLLVQGPQAALARLADDPAFVAIGEHASDVRSRGSPLVALQILVAVVVLAATGVMPIVGAAFLGAAAAVFTRCVRMDEVYRELDWTVVTLLVGLLPLGVALDQSGTAAWIASGLASWLGDAGPATVVFAFYIVSSLLTELMSNQAAAVVLTPVAITTATTLGMNPYALIVTVMFGASASFMTPVGYQTNTLVYAPGGYRFVDYLRVGAPLNVLLAVVASLAIPRLWQ